MKDPFLYLGARKGSFMYWPGRYGLQRAPRIATGSVV